jgi:prepilin-type N-terminal cleavage/methylation domain-containing protein
MRSSIRQRAFTLVEILVVAAIISILVAMLLPALSGAKDRAKTILCLSNLHQVWIVCVSYADDNSGYFGNTPFPYFPYLVRYVYKSGNLPSDGGVFGCPAQPNDHLAWSEWVPSGPGTPLMRYNYGLNSSVLDPVYGRPLQLSAIEIPLLRFLLLDVNPNINVINTIAPYANDL